MAVYADLEDLYAFGAPQSAFRGVREEQLQAQLDVASKRANAFLRNNWTLPLQPLNPPPAIGQPYPEELKEAVAKIAAYNIMSVRGYDPEKDNGALRDRAKEALQWLKDVGAGDITPSDFVGSPAAVADVEATTEGSASGGPMVASSPPRWRRPGYARPLPLSAINNVGTGPTFIEGDDDGWTR